jgi:hypothetical protein
MKIRRKHLFCSVGTQFDVIKGFKVFTRGKGHNRFDVHRICWLRDLWYTLEVLTRSILVPTSAFQRCLHEVHQSNA